MAWTDEQLEAISKRGTNILVSAGAGSGKTAVLTERITTLIQEGHHVNSLLVLTFTNAAAEEMRERVRKRLKELSDNEYCNEALKYIDSAKITTFDGYSLYLVKKYYYVLGISSDIKIANAYYINVKINQFLDEILDKLYENNDPELHQYFMYFKDKDDANLKSNIVNMYYKVLLKLDFNNYLDSYNDFYNDKNIEELIKDYIEILRDDIKALSNALIKLQSVLPMDNDKFNSEIDCLLSSINNLITYEDIYNFINSFSFKSKAKNSTEEYKEARKNITEMVGKIKDKLVFDNEESMKDNILSTKSFSNLFIRIIKELNVQLNNFKKANNYYDFIDIAKMAISLIDNNKDILEEIKNNIYEILVDEYQDTSDLQEAFISKVANNNLYMVGDVKQSIYRFRNANPYIFKDKYESYKNNNGGIKIDLNKNFRSRKEVLNNINTIFNDAMTDEMGDANYILEHQMNYGFDTYDKHKEIEYNMDIILFNNKNDELEEKYSTAEREAFLVAKDIKKLIDSKIKIYDKDIKEFREIKYSDICIIMDRGSNFNLFKQIFEFNGIPTAINADSKLTDNDIMPIISNLINLVISEAKEKYDEKYYHSFYSIGRSYLFELDDNYLFEIVSKTKNNKERIVSEITDIAKNISKNIYNYSAKDIYLNILKEYKVEEKLYKIGNVSESLVVLEYIMDFIENINSIGESLFDINDYIIDLLKNDNDVKYTISVKNSPGVKLMNIHKSKGLEFPICYFCNLSSKFNQSEYRNNVGYLAESGFYYVPENGVSIIKEVGIKNLRKKDISEKIRLFYVALTRTREKMIILHPDDLVIPSNYNEVNTMGNILALAFDNISDYFVGENEIPLSKDYKHRISKKNIDYKEKINYVLNDYLGNVIEKNRISKEVIEVLSDEEQENLDYGNHLHEIMETINFNNPDISYLDKSDYDIVSNVLKNELFKNIKDASTYHEHEFYFNKDGKMYHGIIDLLVVYDDHIDIIDYKLSNIDHKEYDRQLGIYKEYIESVSKLPIKCYLLSLLKSVIREV